MILSVFCLGQFSLSVKILENPLIPNIANRSKPEDHHESTVNGKTTSKLLSRIKHFENLFNGTITIAGKLVNESDIVSLQDDWVPMSEPRQKTGSSQNVTKEQDKNSTSVPIISSTLEQWQDSNVKESYRISSSKKRPVFHVADVSNFPLEGEVTTEKFKLPPRVVETYRVSENGERPQFHVMDLSMFDEDNNKKSRSLETEPEPRFNIESQELEFPSFATQFFGSFGELSSQNYDMSSLSGHHSDHRPHEQYSETYHHRPQLDHHRPEYHHNSHDKHHPKRETHYPPVKKPISSHKPKDVSDLYVDDPWKHINKVNTIIPILIFSSSW